jgi:hypothetical protein
MASYFILFSSSRRGVIICEFIDELYENYCIFVLPKVSAKLDITAFIRELLFGHDCVIVPDFGGFIGNYTPAYIDKDSGMFYPPVKQISFNRNLNHNDGLLVGKISGSAKINYGDSKILVEEFVRELRRKLILAFSSIIRKGIYNLSPTGVSITIWIHTGLSLFSGYRWKVTM